MEEPSATDSALGAGDSSTGIADFDVILGGGFPKGATILLSGSSGSGKTIFSFQWLFEGIKKGENGLYITLTEPLFKTLGNLEKMNFYDRTAIEKENLKIVDLRDFFESGSFNSKEMLSFVEDQVMACGAKRLCVDSITAIAYSIDEKTKIRNFIFELGTILAGIGCTTILTSEVAERGKYSIYQVEEFISDAIIRFDQVMQKDELVRYMQIVKVRGKSYTSEELPFRITADGISVYPKLQAPLDYSSSNERISTGNPELDEMLEGGVFRGSTTLLAGSTGSGKSIMSLMFVLNGLKSGEPCLYVGLEESRGQIVRNAASFGWDLEGFERKGLLILQCSLPTDRLLEEHLKGIKDMVEKNGIKRCVVDSVSCISSHFGDEEFFSFSKRLNTYLKYRGVTTIFTAATSSLMGSETLTDIRLSSVTDNIIMMRYVEIQGELRQVLNIIKTRGSSHNKDLRGYSITEKGLEIGQSLKGFEGIMTGVTRKVSDTIEEKVRDEIRAYIGPMGDTVFEQLKARGLSKKTISDYIEGLSKSGILKREDAMKMKEEIEAIFSA